MTTWITVCDTCKTESWTDDKGQADGEALAVLVESAADGKTDVQVRRHSCLMGCKHGCNVAIQAEDKLVYTLGRFDPSEDAADGIVEYASLHAVSATGQVPFKQWPQAIKGHFVTRLPPLPE